MHAWTYSAVAALTWSLIPLLTFGFAASWVNKVCHRLPLAVQVALPAVFGVPYVIVSHSASNLHWDWLALYLLLPVTLAALLWRAAQRDPDQKGNWRDFLVLFVLGLAVDLRGFDSAWPSHFRLINKLILLDSCLYGFLVIRRLTNVGFDLKLRIRDFAIGLREMLFYAPIAVPVGLALGFLHWHAAVPGAGRAVQVLLFTFFLIAVPEEIYFRGWIQNLLARRVGSNTSLLITSAIFGLSHFNKLARHFNWRYVLLAAIAGIFYGRAWRQQNRVAASAITHAGVDTIWVLLLR